MTKPDARPGSAGPGLSWAPVAVAIVVAVAAVVGLFVINDEPPPPPPEQPSAVEIARAAAARAAAAQPRTPVYDDEIETIYGAPGFGSFDGSNYKTSKRAVELADHSSTDQLMARLALGSERVDTISALGLKSQTTKTDRARIVEKIKPLANHRDPDLRRGALHALSQSGDDGLTAMLDALSAVTADGKADRIEIDLMAAIAEMGPGMQGAVEALAGRLQRTSNAAVQRGAAEALGNMGPKGANALEAAIRQFQSQTHSSGSNSDFVAQMQKVLSQVQQIESIGGK